MNICVNLVVMMLTLCLVIASDVDNQGTESRRLTSRLPARIKSTTARPLTKVRTTIRKAVRKNTLAPLKTSKLPASSEEDDDFFTQLKQLELRGRPKKHRKMKRALMALLLAYKLKFAALFPAIIGGLILLIMTTGLAGFFFALFAAVLGLKS